MKRRFPRISSILPALLAAAGCGGSAAVAVSTLPAASPPVPVRAEPHTTQLTEAEIRAVAELLLMEDRRQIDRPRIESLAHHWSPEIRRRAVLAIGRIHDRDALPLVLAALSDSVEAVRSDAAFAIGLAGDTSAYVIAALREVLPEHPADSMGIEAVGALARLGSAVARQTIIDLLESADVQSPTAAEREALLMLWRMGRELAGFVTLPGRFLASTDPDVRWRAAYPLVRTGAAAGVPLLLPLATDPSAAVRSIAVRALRSPATDSVGQRGAAIATLRRALGDSAAEVRINAAAAIATYRNPPLTDDLIPLLADADGNVRMAAVQALASIGGPSIAQDLAGVAEDETERIGIRIAALAALATADEARAAAEAARWATSDRWLQRLFAARTLGAMPWDRAGSLLVSLSEDADPRVAVGAIGVVSRSDTGAAGRALFLERLRSNDTRVRAAAITGLGRLASTADFAVLMDAYAESIDDTIPDAALAAVIALGNLQRTGVPVDNVFFTRFRPHPDAAVRSQVDRRIGPGWDVEVESAAARGAGFYEDVVRRLVAPALAGEGGPVLVFDGSTGRIEVALSAIEAPLTVNNIISLVESGYFDAGDDPDSRRWHRVVPNFVLQDGEPNGDGSGGPGYAIRDEINRLRYGRGTLGMALSGPDTGGSQFFITHSPQPHLDGGYTVFGTVVNGMEAAQRVVQDDRVGRMEVVWR